VDPEAIVILCEKGRPSFPRVGMSSWSDCRADALAKDLRRCWPRCVEKLRDMHWWTQLRGLRGVMVSVMGGGVYALVAL
jgi:hypothetical protein